MKSLLITQGTDGYVRLALGKGCVAVFRQADYYAAIARGKAEARGCQQATRETHRQGQADAERLAWLDDEGRGNL